MRARKNRRYVKQLVRKHSEETVRAMLKALSTLDNPMCCANLRHHDLDTEPLDQIISPFKLLGLHFKIVKASDTEFTVDMGESYMEMGSGGEFRLERLSDGSFRIMEITGEWIC